MEIDGISQVIRNIEAYETLKIAEVRKRIDQGRRNVLALARRDAPNMLKPTFQSHQAREVRGEIEASISAGHGLEDPRISAWVEFGTGKFVEVPKGLEDYAMTFYVSGKGRLPPNSYLFSNAFREWQDVIRSLKK